MKGVAVVPRLVVELDGSRLPEESAAALVAARLQERLGRPAQLELTFEEPPGPLAPVAATTAGAPLRLLAGGEELFRGEVSAVEHAYDADGVARVRLRAYDRLARLRRRQRLRVHVEVDVEGLARELVADLDLTVRAAAPGPFYPRLFQHRGSDLELLVSTAEAAGLHPVLRGDVLHLVTLEGLEDSAALPGAATPSLTLGEELLEARFETNGDRAFRSVAVRGWDPARVEVHAGRAQRVRRGRPVGDGPPEPAAPAPWELAAEAAADPLQAESLAQSELDRRAGGEVLFWGVAEGSTRLRAGAPVTLEGVAPPFAGRHVLTAVTHTLDESRGWLCHLTSEPPEALPRPTGTSVAPARVTRVDDPEGWGRVRVSLPTYGDVETGWLAVVCPGAGPGKGLVAVPDVDDRVLVLLDHGDPARAIVLGGLFGTVAPLDAGVDGNRVRGCTWSTPDGRRIHLDDRRRSLRLEDGTGSYLELGPEGIRLRSAGDLEIEAPGRAIYIRAAAVDFERLEEGVEAAEPPDRQPPPEWMPREEPS